MENAGVENAGADCRGGKLVQTQQYVDRRAAKRTAASRVVHFAGIQLTEALMTARHQRDACITRCHEDTPRRSQQLR